MRYDAEELEYISTVNGFDIRYDTKNTYKYVIFHPNYSGTWIDEYQNYSEAEEFCNNEDADEWAKEIRSSYWR